ncbi:MAG: protein-export chaperone SecB [Methylobacteriaceae bacterium]|jgi:preprotein translocase subunit SecB|nr:protein-export chaperone SecB [Methylobacteriaceae bacterium]
MAESEANNPGEEQEAPSISILGQYIKDFSFENPNAPRSLQPDEVTPQFGLQVGVQSSQVGEKEYEVILSLDFDAKRGETVLFNVELVYAGIFRMAGIPREQLHPALMIEAPRLLFPFARQIVGDAVRNGGFPAIYPDPIDFVALYRQQMERAQKSNGENKAN